MTTKSGRLLYWAPRILSILFILFLAMFSLDVIEPGKSVAQILTGLLVHNVPVFILTVMVMIAWKHELVGALGFLGAALVLIGFNLIPGLASSEPWYARLVWNFTLILPALLIGSLYYLNWRRANKQS